MTSFMSERTVEFYVIPRFRDLLKDRYSQVLPFFYWRTREGNTLSRRDQFPAHVTVCAMFPRRPKVHEGRLLMTVNEEVYLISEYLAEAGIPPFFGFPRVEAFSELATEFECLWFSPNSNCREYSSHEMSVSNRTTEGSALVGPFKDKKAIHDYIEANAKQQTWCSLLDQLFEIHSRISRDDIITTRFRFGPPYKPVYFLMW